MIEYSNVYLLCSGIIVWNRHFAEGTKKRNSTNFYLLEKYLHVFLYLACCQNSDGLKSQWNVHLGSVMELTQKRDNEV